MLYPAIVEKVLPLLTKVQDESMDNCITSGFNAQVLWTDKINTLSIMDTEHVSMFDYFQRSREISGKYIRARRILKLRAGVGIHNVH